MIQSNNISEWCIKKHESTNHYYDMYLPYSFHLRMVDNVAQDFKYLLDDNVPYYPIGSRPFDELITERTACLRAVWGHDLIEDCRVSYNDVKNHLDQEAAEIIYAVTNEKGKNRQERANDKYYEGIRNTKGAVFVKLCDRIANVQYSKLTKSRQFEMYRGENEHFIKSLGYDKNNTTRYSPMFEYLNNLFTDAK